MTDAQPAGGAATPAVLAWRVAELERQVRQLQMFIVSTLSFVGAGFVSAVIYLIGWGAP